MERAQRGERRPVLIVGAGPTGLVLAIELARRGVPFRLIEKHPEVVAWSRAIFIKSRSLEILAALGLGPALHAEGQIVEGVDLYAAGRRVTGYRFAGLDTPFPYILSLPESAVIAILTEALEALGGRVERGVTFLDLEQDRAEARVRLRREGSGEERLAAAWVVGCDGLHSEVRHAIGIDFEGRDYEERWGVFDTRLAGWERPRATICAQLDAPLVVPFPLGPERWRIYFNTGGMGGEDAAGWVARRLAGLCPEARLVEAEAPQYFQSHSRLAKRFRVGRVFLAGDAAHVSNPIEGHGMNLGMQDSHNLGWKLAAATAGRAGPKLLDSYEAERRAVDCAVVGTGEEAYSWMVPGGEEKRRALFAFVSTPEGQDVAARGEAELELGYSESPIVEERAKPAEPSARGTRIGYRVGEAEGLLLDGAPLSLEALRSGPEPLVLALLGEADAAEAARVQAELAAALRPASADARLAVALLGKGTTKGLLHDGEGRLHERLWSGAPTLCVVRPDGHLGFRCSPPSAGALQAHLALLYDSAPQK